MANARFSVNSIMNYSIPEPNPSLPREIQKGDSDTRTRQLEAQIEQLTLQNVKLQRINRLLKIDVDNLIEEKTSPLVKTIEDLTIANIKLQRTSRLLQLELDEKALEINKIKQHQITNMKSVGPEYEFLVQNINSLQRQITGNPACDETCCFTMKPIDQSNMVMTLPSSADYEDVEVEAQHICRPVIHSAISQGSYALELENKIQRLEQFIDDMDQEKENILLLQTYKDNDLETLKKELRIKDEIVSQLEQDFLNLEEQLENYLENKPDEIPKRNSQILQHRVLASDLLKETLRNDDDQILKQDDKAKQMSNLRVLRVLP